MYNAITPAIKGWEEEWWKKRGREGR